MLPQIDLFCAAQLAAAENVVSAQAGLCAISLTLSITQRDAFCRCNLLPTESRRYGTTGPEVAVGRSVRRCCARLAAVDLIAPDLPRTMRQMSAFARRGCGAAPGQP